MKRVMFFLTISVLLISQMVFAVKTSQVELGENGSYDAKVRIFRDEGGNMLFKDDVHTSPVKLLDLSLRMTEHKALSGLGADDHEQYMNTVRHSSGHSVSFNDALAISPDPGGHTQLGGHLQDSDIHLSKNENEMVIASWKFDAEQEFRDNIRLSRHGEPGKADLLFEDGEDDARIRWDEGYDHFEFNRKIMGTDAETDSFLSNTIIRAPGTLDGSYSKSAPTGKIENFVSVEGIASGNLVDKTADEDISGKWDFLNDVYVDGDLVTSGLLTPQGGIKGLGKGNTITVAKSGGDFTSIQDAVNAAQDGDVILIFPGVYEEQVTISGDDITLLGVDQEKVIIRAADLSNEGTVHLAGLTTGINLQNLSIENTTAFAGKGVALAIVNGSQATVYNCDLISSGRDTIYIYQGPYETWGKFMECYIEGGSDVTSCENTGYFYNCRFYINQSGEEAFFIHKINGDGVVISNCYFDAVGTGMIGSFNSNDDVLYFYNNTVSENITQEADTFYWDYRSHTPTIYHTNGAGNMDLNGYLNATGVIKTGGTERISAEGVISNCTANASLLTAGILDNARINWASPSAFGSSTPANVSTTLLQADNLRINDNTISSTNTNGDITLTPNGTGDLNITAGDIKINGTSVIDASRNGVFVGLQSNTTVWQDFSAVTAGHGNVAAYDVQDGGPTPYLVTGWMVNAINAPTYVQTVRDASCVYFPIPYLAGSVLTRARVKWQAVGTGDGVKLRLVKRDESGATTGWTVVGAQQTYTDAGAPYNVTVSTYDFTDETMGMNYAYAIEVESELGSSGVNLFSVGIESSKRVY